MTQSHILFIALATVIQFIVGALWYSVFFGKKWSQIMGFDQLSKEEQQALGNSMTPFYGLQLGLTILASICWSLLLVNSNEQNWVLMNLVFAGVVIPIQIQSVIWANTNKKYWAMQLIITIGNMAVNFVILGVLASFLL